MSKIEVDAIEPQSGTDLTIGASGDTITVPAGATLVNNGTASGFGDNLEWQSTIVTGTTLTAEAGKGYWINTTSNACTITLPASASVGDTIEFSDYLRTWGTNAVTLNTNSLNFQGATTPNPVYNTNGQSVNLVYSGATQGWIPTVDDDVSYETDPSYSADFLVVAGGGGGGSNDDGGDAAGGGGAGGFRTSTQNFLTGATYTITVGDGGAGSTSGSVAGTNGSNSSISGSGLTTITSAGGGGGSIGSGAGSPSRDGIAGGSGGGAGYNGTGGAGNTPSTSPSQGNNGGNNTTNNGGAGGGGAGAAGTNASGTNVGTSGGAGATSSITGSSVTYAGGGGGGAYVGSGGAGGAGGGGAGGDSGNGAVTAGTVNTGGGGGGGGASVDGAAGGKGVVILSVPTAKYSGTTTGSPTISTSGANTIIKFTGTGSYTA